MKKLIVVDHPNDWPEQPEDVTVITAAQYLSGSEVQPGARIYNLCRSYSYQSTGYYVSLLASARGQKPLPDVMTTQDIRSRSLWRSAGSELNALIQSSLRSLSGDEFVLSVYFGRNLAKRHDRLARALFNLFPAPLLRARFVRHSQWELVSLRTIPLGDIPTSHREFLHQAAAEHFKSRQRRRRAGRSARFDLAILTNPEDPQPPSNPEALKRFEKAAIQLGFAVSFIDRQDYGRLNEFDALFIRETTLVNHHTYRFARRAALEGLAVIDDPDSILRCTNKVFLAELLQRRGINTPPSMIVHAGNADQVVSQLGLPCVLKQPDGAFSAGVIKVNDEQELALGLKRFFKQSDLVLAQRFVPTEFDWRIGLLEGKPLWACRYYMANQHWQIIRRDEQGNIVEGDADSLPLDQVPPKVLETARKAAGAIGQGLYGVDLKASGDEVWVIEVNDNPNIDAGTEDVCLGPQLYTHIMESLLRHVLREPAR